jgi:hypothetical protein
MKTKRSSAGRIVQVELNTDKLADAIVKKLAPFLIGKAKADRDVVFGESLDEACASLGISRTKAKVEIKEGRLKALKAGKKIIITPRAKSDWLASLPASSSKQTLKKTVPHR